MSAKVTQREGEPEVPAEIIAQSIKRIADSTRRMRGSGLTQRAILALLKDATGMNKSEIERVLTGLESLEKLYLTKPKQ